jgi:hypothetical protein
VLKLLKHAARFPDFTFSVAGGLDVAPNMLSTIHELLANKTPRWIEGVRYNKISAVRLHARGDFNGNPTCRVVVKERYTAPWMKPAIWHPNWRRLCEEYEAGLGLAGVGVVWGISFGVDYS